MSSDSSQVLELRLQELEIPQIGSAKIEEIATNNCTTQGEVAVRAAVTQYLDKTDRYGRQLVNVDGLQ
jgi:hypothetical protein